MGMLDFFRELSEAVEDSEEEQKQIEKKIKAEQSRQKFRSPRRRH